MPRERWFFVRGLVREAAHWGSFRQEFANQFPDAHVHFLDVPGNGRYWNRESALSVPEAVDHLRKEFGEIVGSDPSIPNYLVAISLGGMLAIDWITRLPADFKGAILMNTSLGGVSPLHHRLQPQALPLLGKIFLQPDLSKREALILDLTSRVLSSEQREEIARARADIFERRPVSRWNALRQLISAARYRAPAKGPSIPTLILSSLGDRMVSPACSKALAKRWNLPIETHATAGHDLPADAPEWCLQKITAWKATLS
jgi:alpha-beta hydrolase superfamily lysophospholipase